MIFTNSVVVDLLLLFAWTLAAIHLVAWIAAAFLDCVFRRVDRDIPLATIADFADAAARGQPLLRFVDRTALPGGGIELNYANRLGMIAPESAWRGRKLVDALDVARFFAEALLVMRKDRPVQILYALRRYRFEAFAAVIAMGVIAGAMATAVGSAPLAAVIACGICWIASLHILEAIVERRKNALAIDMLAKAKIPLGELGLVERFARLRSTLYNLLPQARYFTAA